MQMTFQEACKLYKEKGQDCVSKEYRSAIQVIIKSKTSLPIDGGINILEKPKISKKEFRQRKMAFAKNRIDKLNNN